MSQSLRLAAAATTVRSAVEVYAEAFDTDCSTCAAEPGQPCVLVVNGKEQRGPALRFPHPARFGRARIQQASR